MRGRSLNKVQLIGNLGSDPESRFVQSGTAMTTFRVATSYSWTDRETNERRERTDWHRVVCWGRVAEIANQYLKKGSQAYIEGELQTRTYDRDGQTHYITEVNCRELIMLGRNEYDAPSPGNTGYDRPAPTGGQGTYGGGGNHNSRQQSQPTPNRQSNTDTSSDEGVDDDIPF